MGGVVLDHFEDEATLCSSWLPASTHLCMTFPPWGRHQGPRPQTQPFGLRSHSDDPGGCWASAPVHCSHFKFPLCWHLGVLLAFLSLAQCPRIMWLLIYLDCSFSYCFPHLITCCSLLFGMYILYFSSWNFLCIFNLTKYKVKQYLDFLPNLYEDFRTISTHPSCSKYHFVQFYLF